MTQRKNPPVPPPRQESVRHAMHELLKQAPQTARDLSAALGIREKDVFGHLEHLRRSLQTSGERFQLVPPACRQCGFLFARRDRLTKPGKCPQCRGTAIRPPEFHVE